MASQVVRGRAYPLNRYVRHRTYRHAPSRYLRLLQTLSPIFSSPPTRGGAPIPDAWLNGKPGIQRGMQQETNNV